MLAILAKDKEPYLPLYLDAIESQTIPPRRIHLYVRTNNNRDRTADLLRSWLDRVGRRYASVYFDASDVPEPVEAYGEHEWNALRFSVLARIRQQSVEHALRKNAHYFVVDCDNFVVPHCLEWLIDADRPVVAPLLRSAVPWNPRYANFHHCCSERGYFVPCPDYERILAREVRGLFPCAVVHCTYLIRREVLREVAYVDGSDDYEYVVFGRRCRSRGIDQSVDNRHDYGFVVLAESWDEVARAPWREEFDSLRRAARGAERSERALVIAPHGGLGNRLRAMASASVLAEITGRKVYHSWFDEPATSRLAHVRELQGLSFETFFEADRIPRWTGSRPPDAVFSEWHPGDFWHPSQSSGQVRFGSGAEVLSIGEDALPLAAHPGNVILLETSLAARLASLEDWDERMTRKYRELFHPLERHRRAIPTKLAAGVSIRRGDFLDHFPEAAQEPGALIEWLRARLPPQSVIFSDDLPLRDHVRAALGQPAALATEGWPDWQRAFAEFLTLSRCERIYGTPGSSFARQAATFGGVPYTPLLAEDG